MRRASVSSKCNSTAAQILNYVAIKTSKFGAVKYYMNILALKCQKHFKYPMQSFKLLIWYPWVAKIQVMISLRKTGFKIYLQVFK